MTTATLLDHLAALAKSQGITTDRALARHIGISQPAITHLRIGRRQPGVRVLHGIAVAFPSLEADIMDYVRTGGK